MLFELVDVQLGQGSDLVGTEDRVKARR